MDESTATHIDELSRRVNDYARRITTLETLVMILNDRLLELEAKTPKNTFEVESHPNWWSSFQDNNNGS